MNTPPSSPTAPLLREQANWVVCDECDAVHQRIALGPVDVAHCQRCNALLGRGHGLKVQSLLALALAALVFLAIGNLTPLVSIEMRGVRADVTLPGALALTWQAGQPGIALLAAATGLVFPFLMIGLRVAVLWPLSQGRRPRYFVPAMHALRWATLWSMVEVFLLSALVAIVRSAGYGTVVPGAGLLAYAALTMLLTSLTAAGLHTLWQLGSTLNEADASPFTPKSVPGNIPATKAPA
jgi:paraquat-inducible protein A